MSAPTLGAVATGGGGGGSRFDSVSGADPAALLAAVPSSISQVCKQLDAEVRRIRPLLASGSDSESTAALGAASLVLAEAAAAVAEAEAVLRLRGLADDDATGWPSRLADDDAMGWPSRRPYLEAHIKQSRMMAAGLQRDPPEEKRSTAPALLTVMTFISGLADNFCRTPPPPAYRARPASTSAVADDLASGLNAVQVSAHE